MGQKILVVDDDRIILKFATNLLQREGHEVATAEDGFAALNLLTSFTGDYHAGMLECSYRVGWYNRLYVCEKEG